MGVSSIDGPIEIAGTPADFILVNPYGIRANDARFINTPRATFSTGELIGEIDGKFGFKVKPDSRGITIDSKGIDTSGLSYFDIITRSAKLDGKIGLDDKDDKRADVKIVTGLNDYDYETRKVTNTENSNKNKPEWGIDSSVFGGG